MKIKIQDKLKIKNDMLIIPVFKDQIKKKKYNLYQKSISTFLKERVKEKEFEGKEGESVFTYISEKNLPNKLLLFGMGNLDEYSSKNARELGAILGKLLKLKKCQDISFFLLEEMIETFEPFYQGIKFSQYKTDGFKTEELKSKDKEELLSLTLITNEKPALLKRKIERAEKISQGMDFIKDLVNSPSNIVDEAYFVKEAKKIAKENRYKIKVLGNKELKKMKWGALLAVNQGSTKQARVIILEYKGGAKKEEPIVLVGKGVIFDTGGYNLKPTRSIETMHQDMAGAATVLGLFKILKNLGIKKNIVAILPIVENLISADSYRPSDIITAYNGKTIEITNTDAEGRLILADSLSYGTEYNPKYMISIATLTGAVAVATGNRYSGLMANDDELRGGLEEAGKETDDLAWPLPIHEDYKKKMDSKVADIRNYDMGSGRYAGSSKAAAFLEKFVDEKKWCHIDIGGTAFTDDPKKYEQNGATAAGLRMLVKFLEK